MISARQILISLAALAAAFLAGAGTISWMYWSPRLDAAETRASAAESQAERDRQAANDTADILSRQSAAIDDLQAKLARAQADAAKAMEAARSARSNTDREAQRTLAETDPPGASELEAVRAAEAAFDAELKRERSQ